MPTYKKGSKAFIRLDQDLVDAVEGWGEGKENDPNTKWAKELQGLLEEHGEGFIPLVVTDVSPHDPEEVFVISKQAMAVYGHQMLENTTSFAFGEVKTSPQAEGVLMLTGMLCKSAKGQKILDL